MMQYWLLKTDPDTYSVEDLERDGQTVWDGVSNPQALIYIRQMKRGDKALLYHTGGDKCIVGACSVLKDAHPDPKDKNGKLAVVEVKFSQPAKTRVTLAQIKSDPAFEDFLLVRNSRLSVMPVSAAQWKKLAGWVGL